MTIRIFRHHWQLPLALLAVVEALVFVAAPFIAERGFLLEEGFPADRAEKLPAALLFAGVMFVCMGAMGLYNARQRSGFGGVLLRVIASVLAGTLMAAVLFYLLPSLSLDRRVLLLTASIAALGSMLVRWIFARAVDENVFKRHVLVYGAGRRAATIAALRRRTDQRGFRLIGFVKADGDDESGIAADRLVVPRGSLCQFCEQNMIDEVVVAMDDRRRLFPMEQLLECRLEGIEVTDLVNFLERETGRVKLDVLNPSWIIFSEGFKRGRLHATLERAFDILASLALLAMAWPVMLLTALAIKIEDGLNASVLYRQQRVGQYGRSFELLKFRSMTENAEQDGQARWAQHNDSRVTRVGAFIRKVRIDELPQVFNVLRGDMSFVGPRPERPEFVVHLERQIPFYRERHTIKPGITGWAQLCYPYGSSDKDALEKLQYDLYYVKNHTLLFYLAVLVQTVEVVLWGKGAR